MNGKTVALIVAGLAVLGLFIVPCALAGIDPYKASTGGEQAQIVSPTMKICPTPKKTTPTPVMKMQVTMANVTPTPEATPARHSYIQGVPKSDLGEPLGIGRSYFGNITPGLVRDQRVAPTASPMPI